MKADSASQVKLLDLQALDNRLAVLARELRNLPAVDSLAAIRERSHQVLKQAAVVEADIEDARIVLARCESDVQVARDRLASDQDRLAASTDAKVSLALEHEIETLSRRLNDLEDAELEVMERLETAEKDRAAVDSEVADLDDQARALEATIEAETQRLDNEVREVHRVRGELAASLPADLVALYEKQRERYGMGAGMLRHGVSEATGMTLTEADLDRIRHADLDDVIICPESSCILVRTDESWAS